MQRRLLLGSAAAALFAPAVARAQGRTVNVYSARHYDSDKSLWESFTRASGIRVRVIEANADQLIERIRAEGANSPADVLITVDAGRLVAAQNAGLLQPTQSRVLDANIPAHLRDEAGHWFAFSLRARVIMFDKAVGLPAGLARYEDLAKPEYRGMISVRSSSNIYNVVWTASMMAANGDAATEAWARGIAANLSRPPQGGDTDQIRAVAAGQGRLAISNTYYLGNLARAPRAEDRALAERIGVLFPNQGDRGTHVNVSGAGVARGAPNREEAVKFLEFCASPEAQAIFADGNNEYPVAPDAQPNAFLRGLGSFKQDLVNAGRVAARSADSLRLMQAAGWR
jgi:iron(III) transport system substrate-binding protein